MTVSKWLAEFMSNRREEVSINGSLVHTSATSLVAIPSDIVDEVKQTQQKQETVSEMKSLIDVGKVVTEEEKKIFQLQPKEDNLEAEENWLKNRQFSIKTTLALIRLIPYLELDGSHKMDFEITNGRVLFHGHRLTKKLSEQIVGMIRKELLAKAYAEYDKLYPAPKPKQ